MVKCLICKTEFTPHYLHPNAQTCSRKCSKRMDYLKHKEKYGVKNLKGHDTLLYCKVCKKQIILDRTKPLNLEVQRKYCSIKCRRTLENIKRKKHILKEKKCLFCENVFTPHYIHPQAKFCSDKCNKAYYFFTKYRALISKYPKQLKTKKYCKECGGLIIFDESKGNNQLCRQFCSPYCYNKNQHRAFKTNNPEGYKKHKIQSKLRYREKRKAVIHEKGLDKHFMKLRKKGICLGYKRPQHFVGADNLQLDHIYPIARADKDYKKTGKKRIYTTKDIQPLCIDCNRRKNDKLD